MPVAKRTTCASFARGEGIRQWVREGVRMYVLTVMVSTPDSSLRRRPLPTYSDAHLERIGLG